MTGFGKNAQVFIGDIPVMTESNTPTAATSTGIPGCFNNTGSLATSSYHGRGATVTAATTIGARVHGCGKNAQVWNGDGPVTDRTTPTAATSTGIPGWLRNTGSLATSLIHGSRAGQHTDTNGSGKNAQVWSRPAIESTKQTAAGSTGTESQDGRILGHLQRFNTTNCLTECHNEWEPTGGWDGCYNLPYHQSWRQPCDWEGIDEEDSYVFLHPFRHEYLWITEWEKTNCFNPQDPFRQGSKQFAQAAPDKRQHGFGHTHISPGLAPDGGTPFINI